MKTTSLFPVSLLGLTILFSGCYMHHPAHSGHHAPVQSEAHMDEPEGEDGDYEDQEGEVPPPAPGSEEEYYDEEPAPPPVHPGPTW